MILVGAAPSAISPTCSFWWAPAFHLFVNHVHMFRGSPVRFRTKSTAGRVTDPNMEGQIGCSGVDSLCGQDTWLFCAPAPLSTIGCLAASQSAIGRVWSDT